MPISTPLSARLGIRHPILSAPMDVIAGARLTAAVSVADGFGILGGGYGDKAWLEQEAAKLRSSSAVATEYAAAQAAENFEIAAVIAGEAVGLIHDVPPAADIIDRIVTEADQILSGRRNVSATSTA